MSQVYAGSSRCYGREVRVFRAIRLSVLLFCSARGWSAPSLEIEQVLANGQPVAISPNAGVVLPPGRHDLEIRFRTQGETPGGWIVQYQFAGHDATWRTVDGEMALFIRQYDGSGRELASFRAPVPGQNLGFPSVQRRSNLNRRIEPVVVADGAKELEVVFDSGTWRPELTGEWVIGEVTVNRSNQAFGPQESIWQNPLLQPLDPTAKDNFPQLWERRGDPGIARLEKDGPHYLITLRDFSNATGGAWVSRQSLPSEVKPGEVLTIGWWERSRVGDQRPHSARYADVPPGEMLFRAVGRGVGAVYLEQDILLPVVIRPYIWTEPWFAPAATLVGGSILGLVVWQSLRRRYRRNLARLELEAQIEKDRMRIARDMHDELGASLTRIALMSDLAAFEPEGDGKAGRRFGEISKAARSVSSTLDQIVWTVNPRNDTIERLVGYVAEFATEYLESVAIPLQLELPPEIPATPISSEARHQVLLGVKEALNNVAKYAGASSVAMRVVHAAGQLTIVIADDGRGFDPAAVSPFSNGLRNMRQRFSSLRGTAQIESRPGAGTTVTFRVPLG